MTESKIPNGDSYPNAVQMICDGYSAAQARGEACLFCRTDFTTSAVASQPVPHVLTGGQVFACVGECVSYDEWLSDRRATPFDR